MPELGTRSAVQTHVASANYKAGVTALCDLLSSAAFRQRSGASLAALRNLPAAAASSGAALLAPFHQLRWLGLLSSARANMPRELSPDFFPPSLHHSQAWANSFEGLGWLPSFHLQSVELLAEHSVILGPDSCDIEQAPLSCSCLTIRSKGSMYLYAAALHLLANRCERLEVQAVRGGAASDPGAIYLRALSEDCKELEESGLPVCLLDPETLLQIWLRTAAPLCAGPAMRAIAADASQFVIVYRTGNFSEEDKGMAMLNPLAWCDHAAGFEFIPHASLGGVAATLRSVSAPAPDVAPTFQMLIQTS